MAQQVIKLVVNGSIFSATQTRLSFYYGRDALNVTDDDIHVCVDALHTLFSDACAIIDPSTMFYSCDAYVLDVEGKWRKRTSTTWNQPGYGGGGLVAFQVAALIEATTQLFRARGRKFFPGVAQDSTLDGSLTGEALLYVAQVAYDYVSPVFDITTGHEWFPGTVSKRAIFVPFVSGIVGTILSTIRRRKPGYGI
jgi:hypothetical protein